MLAGLNDLTIRIGGMSCGLSCPTVGCIATAGPQPAGTPPSVSDCSSVSSASGATVKSQGKGTVLAAKAVKPHGKGTALAAKAVKPQGKGSSVLHGVAEKVALRLPDLPAGEEQIPGGHTAAPEALQRRAGEELRLLCHPELPISTPVAFKNTPFNSPFNPFVLREMCW